jgi:hypothetical protein
MDVLLEYSNKKQTVGSSRQPSREWSYMVQRILMYPCRQLVCPAPALSAAKCPVHVPL